MENMITIKQNKLIEREALNVCHSCINMYKETELCNL